MRFSDNGMSAILLCSYIGIRHNDTLKPLSLKEWNEFLDRTAQYGQQPGIVMKQDQTFLKEAGYGQEYAERIKKLVFRGGTVAFELDDLQRKGIEVITPYDQDYPVLLKRRLKKKTPPVLFYSGDITLAKKIGIGVVGSRNVDDNGIRFTQALVEKAASERLIVYSGGAKGVDTISERAAIESGSAAVSFVADSLLSKIRKKDLIDSIISKQRLLISDVKPDVGFTAARAMNRNKYIYASSYGTFVVASDYNKGGTWAGATEAMRNGWTKVLVWNGGGYEGNKKLIEKGAVPYELSEASVYDMVTRKEEDFQQIDMFSFAQSGGKRQEAASQQKELSKQPEVREKGEEEMTLPQKDVPPPEERRAEQAAADGRIDLYDVAGSYIMAHIGDGMTRDEAAEVFQVAKKQMETWLKRLCQESRLKCVKGRYVRWENT
ncbi:MAG: DNA-processing protein DprA [Hungatella sp.]|nr:DNA-processing protein DprA [Hungatella sp.]